MGARRRPVFDDRRHAGRTLARALESRRPDSDAVVVGLARGGVEVAAEVARELGLPFEALAVRKIGHPWQPEYALGATTPTGGTYLRDSAGLHDEDLAALVAAARRAAHELNAKLHRARPAIDVAGRGCILVDDGLATGATMVAAVRWAREAGAAWVIAAVPVGAPASVDLVGSQADEVVSVHTVGNLRSVGSWYRSFEQVSDAEVIALLAQREAQ